MAGNLDNPQMNANRFLAVSAENVQVLQTRFVEIEKRVELLEKRVASRNLEKRVGNAYTYSATFYKEHNIHDLGIDVQAQGDHLVVGKVIEGYLAHAYNVKQPENAIQSGDLIISVNGITGDADKMIAESKRQKALDIQFVRENYESDIHVITIDKKDPADDLGLDVAHQDGKTLHVKNVIEGQYVDKYNSSNPKEKGIMPGDRILKVNNEAGDVQKMLSVARQSSSMTLHVRRPANPGKTEKTRIVKYVKGPTNTPIGLDVKQDGNKIRVVNVVKGMGIDKWNQDHPNEKGIRKDDRIVKVNDVSDDYDKMIEATTKGTTVVLEVEE